MTGEANPGRFGPNTKAVEELLIQAGELSRDEMEAFEAFAKDRDTAAATAEAAARDTARYAAWRAALDVALDAAWEMAWEMAWNAAWEMAWEAIRCATLALVTWDLIDEPTRRTLTKAWVKTVGPLPEMGDAS